MEILRKENTVSFGEHSIRLASSNETKRREKLEIDHVFLQPGIVEIVEPGIKYSRREQANALSFS